MRPAETPRGGDATPAGAWPPVSVIVAARDAAATLPACLASIRALDYPSVEILVVDDGSTDATAAVAEAHGARVLRAGGRGASAARNVGARAARGDVLAFTDADCEVPPDWLRALVPPLRLDGVVSAGGPQIHVFPDAGLGSRAVRAFFACASAAADYTRTGGRAREVGHNASCNSVYLRAPLLAAGGFREGLWPAEDVDLDRRLTRAGHRCWFVPQAAVRHHRPGGIGWFRRMMRRYGRGQGVLVRLHGPFRRIDAVPALVFALVAAQAGWAWPPARPWLAALHGAAAGAALLALGRGAPLPLWLPVSVVAVLGLAEWHLGYVTGLLTHRTSPGEPVSRVQA